MSLSLFSDMKYYNRINETGVVAIVDMLANSSVFNFCDPTQYTKEGVRELLIGHGLQAGGKERWVAYFDDYHFYESCRFSDWKQR